MLPTELLSHRLQGEEVIPKRLALQPATLALAAELIEIFRHACGKPRAELNAELQVLEGEGHPVSAVVFGSMSVAVRAPFTVFLMIKHDVVSLSRPDGVRLSSLDRRWSGGPVSGPQKFLRTQRLRRVSSPSGRGPQTKKASASFTSMSEENTSSHFAASRRPLKSSISSASFSRKW